ncbi:MAG: metallophosphoesterase family protein [Paracoccaceae bacterium]
MRLAILTDIHGNREAFGAVLQDLAARKIDRIVMLGDIVGYGPDPEWCVDKAQALVAAGALCVKGNHDSAIGSTELLNANAKQAIDWTRPRLDAGQKQFLADLPLTQSEGDLLFVHASANDPGGWIYVTSDNKALPSFRVSKARVIFCGHVHVPALISCDMGGSVRQQRIPMAMPVPLIRSRRWLAVVGSVGQPRDQVAQAGYAVFDTETNELTFRRVAYDTATTARKVREAGLPESLALRLMRGE